MKGHVDIVRYLLEQRANPEARVHSSGDRCLHVAAKAGHDGVVEMLLAFGAEPTAKNEARHRLRMMHFPESPWANCGVDYSALRSWFFV